MNIEKNRGIHAIQYYNVINNNVVKPIKTKYSSGTGISFNKEDKESVLFLLNSKNENNFTIFNPDKYNDDDNKLNIGNNWYTHSDNDSKNDKILDVEFSKTNFKTFSTCCSDGSIKIWNYDYGNDKVDVKETAYIYEDEDDDMISEIIYPNFSCFHPTLENSLCASYNDNTLRLWMIEQNVNISDYAQKDEIFDTHFSELGTFLWSTNAGKYIYGYDVRNDSTKPTFELLAHSNSNVSKLKFLSDENYFVSAHPMDNKKCRVQLFDVRMFTQSLTSHDSDLSTKCPILYYDELHSKLILGGIGSKSFNIYSFSGNLEHMDMKFGNQSNIAPRNAFAFKVVGKMPTMYSVDESDGKILVDHLRPLKKKARRRPVGSYIAEDDLLPKKVRQKLNLQSDEDVIERAIKILNERKDNVKEHQLQSLKHTLSSDEKEDRTVQAKEQVLVRALNQIQTMHNRLVDQVEEKAQQEKYIDYVSAQQDMKQQTSKVERIAGIEDMTFDQLHMYIYLKTSHEFL